LAPRAERSAERVLLAFSVSKQVSISRCEAHHATCPTSTTRGTPIEWGAD
jgi:hypothetical protein